MESNTPNAALFVHAGRKPEVLSSQPIIKTSPALWQNTAGEPLLTQSSNKLLHVRGTQVDGLEILEELFFADLQNYSNKSTKLQEKQLHRMRNNRLVRTFGRGAQNTPSLAFTGLHTCLTSHHAKAAAADTTGSAEHCRLTAGA